MRLPQTWALRLEGYSRTHPRQFSGEWIGLFYDWPRPNQEPARPMAAVARTVSSCQVNSRSSSGRITFVISVANMVNPPPSYGWPRSLTFNITRSLCINTIQRGISWFRRPTPDTYSVRARGPSMASLPSTSRLGALSFGAFNNDGC